MSNQTTTEDYFKTDHGFLSRILHRCAFQLDPAHRVLVDLEDLLYGGRLKDIPIQDPLFVAGLPRSGTTLLLRILVNGGPFASHTHREVPFVLSPLIWNEYAGLFGRSIPPRERAHGDGMIVSDRSPAALEEVLWKFFWPSHYRENYVEPWQDSDSNPEFREFFKRHVRKIKLLRDGERPDRLRYVSKNNLNLARLRARPIPMNEGRFLIPFRHPIQQASSLFEQHQRFTRIHNDQPFVADYMNFLGHHEFGKTFRPIRFEEGILDDRDPDEFPFWVRYWIQVHREILDCDADGIHLVSYDSLVKQPKKVLGRLAELLGLPDSTLADRACAVGSPRSHGSPETLPENIRTRALDLFEDLNERARKDGLT